MRCNPANRWGPGTCKEKAVDSDLVKQTQKRLADMAAERAKQDQMWSTAASSASSKTINIPSKTV